MSLLLKVFLRTGMEEQKKFKYLISSEYSLNRKIYGGMQNIKRQRPDRSSPTSRRWAGSPSFFAAN